jgi:hypothetical protein
MIFDFPQEIKEVLQHNDIILCGSSITYHFIGGRDIPKDYDFIVSSKNDINNQSVFNLSLVLENNGWKYMGKTKLGGIKLSKNNINIDIFHGDLFTLPFMLSDNDRQYLYYPKENKIITISC